MGGIDVVPADLTEASKFASPQRSQFTYRCRYPNLNVRASSACTSIIHRPYQATASYPAAVEVWQFTKADICQIKQADNPIRSLPQQNGRKAERPISDCNGVNSVMNGSRPVLNSCSDLLRNSAIVEAPAPPAGKPVGQKPPRRGEVPERFCVVGRLCRGPSLSRSGRS